MGGKLNNFFRKMLGRPTIQKTDEYRVYIRYHRYDGKMHFQNITKDMIEDNSIIIPLGDSLLEVKNCPQFSSKELYSIFENKEIHIARKYMDSNGKEIFGIIHPI